MKDKNNLFLEKSFTLTLNVSFDEFPDESKEKNSINCSYYVE